MAEMQKPTLRRSNSVSKHLSAMIFMVASFLVGSFVSVEQHAYSYAWESREKTTGGPTTAVQPKRNEVAEENGEYTWIGNHWVPPKGVPTYSAAQMREVFSKHSVLFLGDSLTRRAYLTLFQITNITGPINGVTESDLEDPRIINLNKRGMPWEECANETRDRSTLTNTRGTMFPLSNSQYFCRELASTNPYKTTGKMDYGSIACFKGALEFVLTELGECDSKFMDCKAVHKNVTRMSSEFDIIVFGLGIWDAAVPHLCKDPYRADLTIRKVLDGLARLSRTRNGLPIIWRTSGFEADGKGTLRNEFLNRLVRKSIVAERNNSSGLSYVDFGRDIKARSFGKQRISGDISTHYGLEARLMYLNMLTHQIVTIGQQQQK